MGYLRSDGVWIPDDDCFTEESDDWLKAKRLQEKADKGDRFAQKELERMSRNVSGPAED